MKRVVIDVAFIKRARDLRATVGSREDTTYRDFFTKVFQIHRVSDLVEFMIVGLRNAEQRPDFKVKMYTFGSVEDGVCVGCAATAAMCELLPRPFLPEDQNYQRWAYRVFQEARVDHLCSDPVRLSRKVVERAEFWFDALRRGDAINHKDWSFGLGDEAVHKGPYPRPCLDTRNWREHLPAYQAWADELREQGL